MATSTITDTDGTEYPVRKHGSKWICEGPRGRFFAHSKREAERLLRETGGIYDAQMAQDNEDRERRQRPHSHAMATAAQRQRDVTP